MTRDMATAALDYWKHNHLQSPRLVPGQPHRGQLAAHIAQLVPAGGAVLEFGCSSGRNLATLRALCPDLTLHGIDAAPQSLAAGRDTHGATITFTLGDEVTLRALANGDTRYDVAFTCSVLDHIPEPEWRHVYHDLCRVSRVAVVLLEPIMRNGDYGWREADLRDLGIHAAPYTWVHDYLTNDPALRLVAHMPIEAAPDYGDFGQLYWLMERRSAPP